VKQSAQLSPFSVNATQPDFPQALIRNQGAPLRLFSSVEVELLQCRKNIGTWKRVFPQWGAKPSQTWRGAMLASDYQAAPAEPATLSML
jgi:hypothetical protein